MHARLHNLTECTVGVNLSTHTLEKTLTVVGNPRTVLNTQNSEYDKVYVASPNSPYVTIIETTPTEIDVIDTTVLLEGMWLICA